MIAVAGGMGAAAGGGPDAEAGLLSTAPINHKLRGARDVEGVKVVVTGSRDLARAAAGPRAGLPCAVGSYDAFLEDPEVDAVYIVLPNAAQVPWTIRALQAGKHVLCEKPMSRRPEDVHAAFDAADRGGLVLAEAFMWRHHPATARLPSSSRRSGRSASSAPRAPSRSRATCG